MLLWMALALVLSQDPPKPKPEPKQDAKKPVVKDEDKPRTAKDEDKPRTAKDEDENVASEIVEYTYDPAKAKHQIDAGNVYMHRGSYNAAARRYEEATKWQPNNVQAFMKLGLALEKKDDPFRAAQAYRKVLELVPSDRQR